MITTEITNQYAYWFTAENLPICRAVSITKEQNLNWSKLASKVKRGSGVFVLPIVLDICEQGTSPIWFQESGLVKSFDQTMNGWLNYIRDEFYAIPQVEAIFVAIDDRDVDIWLIIPNRDFALLRTIVEREMKVMKVFTPTEKPLFLFEFHIVYRCGAAENELVPREAVSLPRQ
jgi:hypothetical protein